MKRTLLIIAVIAVGALSVGALIIYGSSDEDIYDDLSEMIVARPLLIAEYSRMSCECVGEREDSDELFEECMAETRELESTIDDIAACVIDSIHSLDSPPPASIESVVECSRTKIGEVGDCMDAATEEHDECSVEFFNATRKCQTELMLLDCSEFHDEESEAWMEEGAEAFDECLADPSDVPGAVDADRFAELVAGDDRAQIRINLEAIKVGGQVVQSLSGGHLHESEGRLGSLPSLEDGLRAFRDDNDLQRYQIHAHGLVPYLTMARVMLTVTETDANLGDIRLDHIDESSYAVNDDHLRPDEKPHHGPPEGDREPLELSISVSDEGFYVSADHSVLDAIDGCDPSGPTVCMSDNEVDTSALFDQARQAQLEGDYDLAAHHYDRALDAYDFRGLYNELRKLSRNHRDESMVRISATAELPLGLIYEVMNSAQFQLAEDHYDDRDSYRQARLDGPGEGWLFPDVAFAVHK